MNDWYCDEVLSGARAIGIVAETPAVLAFHHTRPSYADAHVVVIPKVHTPSLLDAQPKLLADLFDIVKAIAADVEAEFGACRIVTNLGGYQDSKHLHWHVVSGERVAEPSEIVSETWLPYSGGPPTPSPAFYAALPRRYVGAGALIVNDDGDVLVVKPAYKAGWELPGGVVEKGETPAAACARECLEELGLDLCVGRVLVVDHQSIDERGDSTMYIYDAGSLPAEVNFSLPVDEITEAKFVSPSRLSGLFPSRIERRVSAAIEAKADGSTTELHGGFGRSA